VSDHSCRCSGLHTCIFGLSTSPTRLELGIVCAMDLDATVRAARSGDVPAKRELVVWVYRELQRFFANYFDCVDNDILTHTTIIELLEKLPEYSRPTSEFRSWMLGFAGIATKRRRAEIGRERARKAALRRWARPSKPGPLARSPTPGPLSALVEIDRKNRMHQYLPLLPDKLRLALEHWLAGGDDESFAAAHNISVVTARTRRHRAVQRLKELAGSPK
jgi:DNA-directed RNA polymerase specialized sigma24 family protein